MGDIQTGIKNEMKCSSTFTTQGAEKRYRKHERKSRSHFVQRREGRKKRGGAQAIYVQGGMPEHQYAQKNPEKKSQKNRKKDRPQEK
jgi:hypothetical protein